MKIVVCDPISPKGIALLQQRPEFEVVVLPKRLPEPELLPLVADAVALLVRSETKVTRKVIEAAPKLRVVGRAGVGVDNVDIEAATQHGTVVMNTPGGNTVTTAELSFAMLLALARKVPQAHTSMAAGKWDRKLFQGMELLGKTLGILGMGRIGSEVAKRAKAFGMRVIAYDPYLTEDRAKAVGAEFADSVDDVYRVADFITVHMPVTPETKHMLNAAAFSQNETRCPPGELRPRRNYCRERPDCRARIRQGCRRGAGCFCRGTAARRPPVSQTAQCDFDAAPRREHARRRRKNAASKSPKWSRPIC